GQRAAQAGDARPGRARALRDPARADRGLSTPRGSPPGETPRADAGDSPTIATLRAPVDHIAAPPFPAKLAWVNVATLRMDQQRGRPVLIEFWDFCRPNSMRTLPYLTAWNERY